jgi:hypothetical protein
MSVQPKRAPKLPKAVVGRGGGVGQAGQGGRGGGSSYGEPYISPPPLSFDPSIEAERRAAVRGYEDTGEDIASKEHFGQRDLAHALAKLKTSRIRGTQDISRSAERGRQKLDYQESDAQTKAARAREDFNTQLSGIARQFANLGHRQVEGANAAGVLDQGTLAAGAAARGVNQGLAEAPIHTAQGRLEEDLATALGRIGTARGEVGQDEQRGLTRLGQDVTRERKSAQRERGREHFENQRTKGRAKREEEFSQVDLLAKEIYASRAEHPAIFRAWANQHPAAIAKAKGEADANKATGGNVQQGVGGGGSAQGPSNGGTSAPNKKKKGRK